MARIGVKQALAQISAIRNDRSGVAALVFALLAPVLVGGAMIGLGIMQYHADHSRLQALTDRIALGIIACNTETEQYALATAMVERIDPDIRIDALGTLKRNGQRQPKRRNLTEPMIVTLTKPVPALLGGLSAGRFAPITTTAMAVAGRNGGARLIQ